MAKIASAEDHLRKSSNELTTVPFHAEFFRPKACKAGCQHQDPILTCSTKTFPLQLASRAQKYQAQSDLMCGVDQPSTCTVITFSTPASRPYPYKQLTWRSESLHWRTSTHASYHIFCDHRQLWYRRPCQLEWRLAAPHQISNTSNRKPKPSQNWIHIQVEKCPEQL